ncbi:unnamed protein product [Chrysoparadoxa australica]
MFIPCHRFFSFSVSAISLLLIACRLVVPTQAFISCACFAYGVPVLAMYCMQRETLGHWDSLFLVYGLSFLVLPKISPLQFLHAFGGSHIFASIYLTWSLVKRKSDMDWGLSTVYLGLVVALFNHISYTTERNQRERWLLRDRLRREGRVVQLKSLHLRDDIAANLDGAVTASAFFERYCKEERPSGGSQDQTRDQQPQEQQLDEKGLVLRGLGAWLTISLFGWIFNTMDLQAQESIKDAALRVLPVSSDAYWPMLMHSVGFSSFLLLVTRRIRWVCLTAGGSFAILCALSAVPERWQLVVLHSTGYILLFTVVLGTIGVGAGAVWVWGEVISFLKRTCMAYPQVQDDMRSNKLLESVMVRIQPSGVQPQLRLPYGEGCQERERTAVPTRQLTKVLNRPCCLFCSKQEVRYHLPVCGAWASNESSEAGVHLCTPYTAIMKQREALKRQLDEKDEDMCAMRRVLEEQEVALQAERSKRSHAEAKAFEASIKIGEMERAHEARLRERESDWQGIVSGLTEQMNQRVHAMKGSNK